MHDICRKIWQDKQWPHNWTKVIFVPLPKAGDLKECKNYRNVSLICHASQIMHHTQSAQTVLRERTAGRASRFQSWTGNQRYVVYTAASNRKDLGVGRKSSLFDLCRL